MVKCEERNTFVLTQNLVVAVDGRRDIKIGRVAVHFECETRKYCFKVGWVHPVAWR
jgi:hypothetical protein